MTDLFDFLPEEIERKEKAEKARIAEQQPATCPSCATTEQTGWLLKISHGYDPVDMLICGFPRFQHPNFGALCSAQHLKVNHIIYGLKYLGAPRPEDVERARELRVDVEAVIAEFEARE